MLVSWLAWSLAVAGDPALGVHADGEVAGPVVRVRGRPVQGVGHRDLPVVVVVGVAGDVAEPVGLADQVAVGVVAAQERGAVGAVDLGLFVVEVVLVAGGVVVGVGDLDQVSIPIVDRAGAVPHRVGGRGLVAEGIVGVGVPELILVAARGIS